MSSTQHKFLARRFIEEFVNAADVHRLTEFLALDFVTHHVNGPGHEWAREHILTFHRCYPDLRVTVDGQVAEDDTVVTWWTMRGTNTGGWRGVPPTHKRIVLHGVDINKIRKVRIVEAFGGSDSLEALMALGVVQWASGQPVEFQWNWSHGPWKLTCKHSKASVHSTSIKCAPLPIAWWQRPSPMERGNSGATNRLQLFLPICGLSCAPFQHEQMSNPPPPSPDGACSSASRPTLFGSARKSRA